MATRIESSSQQPMNISKATDLSEDQVLELPNELFMQIFFKLNSNDQNTITNVCRRFRAIINDPHFLRQSFPKCIFGKEEWEKYIGKVGDVPSLPPNIYKILRSPCAFNPGKGTYEAQLLTLIPATVKGKPFTLNSLGELVKTPKEGNAAQFTSFPDEIKNEYGDIPVKASYWVLFTKDVIPNSRNLLYTDQEELLKKLSTKAKAPYAVPELLDVATSLFMEFVRSGTPLYASQGFSIGNDNGITYTRIKERTSTHPDWPLIAGAFTRGLGWMPDGLAVEEWHTRVGRVKWCKDKLEGMGASRKFTAIQNLNY